MEEADSYSRELEHEARELRRRADEEESHGLASAYRYRSEWSAVRTQDSVDRMRAEAAQLEERASESRRGARAPGTYGVIKKKGA